MIKCARCQSETEGFATAPLGGPMAAELLAHACPGCFRDWMNTEVMIINEYRLDLSLPRNQELLDLEMAKFLNLPSAAHAGPQGEGSG